MNLFKSKSAVLTGIFLLVAACILLVWIKPETEGKIDLSKEMSDSTFSDWDEPYILFNGDSTLKVVYDTIVSVWDTRSGEKINEFYVHVSINADYPEVKQMELDMSGKYLGILDNNNIVSVYNILSGQCEGFNDYYFDQMSHIYFSNDAKYLLLVDYREATVDILQCPQLEHIATGNMGFYRSNFYWEERNGKLIFYYEVVDSLYRTVFPDDRHGDSLVFSEPVKVSRVVRNNSEDE